MIHNVRRVIEIAAVLVLSSISLAAVAYDYTGAPLKERQLASLSVSLPDWTIVEESDLGSTGRIKLADPMGQARFLRITWHVGDVSLDVLAGASAMAKAGLNQQPAMAIHVSGREVSVLRFATEGETKRLAISRHYCSDTDTTLVVWSFINSGWSDSLNLLERVLSSVRCNATNVTTRVMPLFMPRNGYRKVEDVNVGVVYANATGNMLMFSSIQPPNRAMNLHDWKVGAFKDIYTTGMGLKNLKFQVRSKRLGDKDVWVGSADKVDGTKVFVLATWWECSKPAHSFFGGYVGSADPVTSKDAELLASAQCP